MIQKSSLVVSLSISQWTARRHDKKITNEVREQHNASDDAGRYNKLLAAKSDLEAVSKAASAIRTFHYDHTIPWGDNNERLLKGDHYMDYLSELTKHISKFDNAADEVRDRMDRIIEDAKVRLNGMFNPNDYPSLYEIRDKYAVKVTFMPVPETDFRLNLSQQELDKLRGDVEMEVNTRLHLAVADTWKRIKDQLSHMRDKLRDEKAVFRDSLFENLKELIQLLPSLNVTDDQNLQLACTEMAQIMTSPDAVRANPDLRQIKADEVDKVLNQFSSFFPS
jgi:hypothetical protein